MKIGGASLEHYLSYTRGQYTVTMNEKEFVLNAGDELLIPKGSVQCGSCIAGTRTIHDFGGKRIVEDKE